MSFPTDIFGIIALFLTKSEFSKLKSCIEKDKFNPQDLERSRCHEIQFIKDTGFEIGEFLSVLQKNKDYIIEEVRENVFYCINDLGKTVGIIEDGIFNYFVRVFAFNFEPIMMMVKCLIIPIIDRFVEKNPDCTKIDITVENLLYVLKNQTLIQKHHKSNIDFDKIEFPDYDIKRINTGPLLYC